MLDAWADKKLVLLWFHSGRAAFAFVSVFIERIMILITKNNNLQFLISPQSAKRLVAGVENNQIEGYKM